VLDAVESCTESIHHAGQVDANGVSPIVFLNLYDYVNVSARALRARKAVEILAYMLSKRGATTGEYCVELWKVYFASPSKRPMWSTVFFI